MIDLTGRADTPVGSVGQVGGGGDAGGGPEVTWPIPIEVPVPVLVEMVADADVHTVVVREGAVLHAPGNHHHKVHDAQWELALGPNRELTIHFPDGTVRNTGPPRRNAA